MINNSQIEYLKALDKRFHNGFSWQHEDYFNLKELVPEMLCHLCIHGDKNDGICMKCFNFKHFKYYEVFGKKAHVF